MGRPATWERYTAYVLGDVSLGVVGFLGSCFVVRWVRGLESSGVHTPLLNVAVDTRRRSDFGLRCRCFLCIYRAVSSLS
jgi:hypothetical protein